MLNKIKKFFRSRYFLPILIVAMTLLTHGVNLWGYPSFEGDEGTYTSQAWWLVRFGQLAPYTYWYDHPPFGWLQIGLWQILTGGPFTFGFSLFSTRILMVLIAAATNLLIFLLTRSLTKSKNLAFLASVFFAFSPLCIFFHRRVLLDNLLTFWLLLSLCLLWGKRTLSRFWASGLAFGMAFLSKETAIVFLPVMVYAVWKRTRVENRKFCLLAWLTSALFLISLFPLLAVLKNEFFPAGWLSQREHVSLLETLVFQAKRGTSAKPWQEGSLFQTALAGWNKIDFLGMYWGLFSILINLFLAGKSLSSRVFSLLSFSYLLFLARGGLVLDFYIVPLLALFAVNLALALKALESACSLPRHFTRLKTAVPIVLALLLISQHPQLFREKATASQLEAVSFVQETLPQNAFIAVDDFALVDFRLEGRFSNAEWFSKVENDPKIREKLDDNWEELDYILLSHEMLRNLAEGNLPFLEDAYNHSFLVKDFPPGPDTSRNLGNLESTAGDWAALLKVSPSLKEQKLANTSFGDLF